MLKNAAYGRIDNLSNLAQNAAYVTTGAFDTVTPPVLGEAIIQAYGEVGMSPDLLEYELCETCAHSREDGKNGEVM